MVIFGKLACIVDAGGRHPQPVGVGVGKRRWYRDSADCCVYYGNIKDVGQERRGLSGGAARRSDATVAAAALAAVAFRKKPRRDKLSFFIISAPWNSFGHDNATGVR